MSLDRVSQSDQVPGPSTASSTCSLAECCGAEAIIKDSYQINNHNKSDLHQNNYNKSGPRNNNHNKSGPHVHNHNASGHIQTGNAKRLQSILHPAAGQKPAQTPEQAAGSKSAKHGFSNITESDEDGSIEAVKQAQCLSPFSRAATQAKDPEAVNHRTKPHGAALKCPTAAVFRRHNPAMFWRYRRHATDGGGTERLTLETCNKALYNEIRLKNMEIERLRSKLRSIRSLTRENIRLQKQTCRQEADLELGRTREQLMGVINTVLEKEYYLLLSKVDEMQKVLCGEKILTTGESDVIARFVMNCHKEVNHQLIGLFEKINNYRADNFLATNLLEDGAKATGKPLPNASIRSKKRPRTIRQRQQTTAAAKRIRRGKFRKRRAADGGTVSGDTEEEVAELPSNWEEPLIRMMKMANIRQRQPN